MTVECFLDTNILLYAASKNLAHQAKKKIAIELIAGKQFGLSAQVLQEFYATATRKADFRMEPETALGWIEKLDEFICLSIDSGLIKTAALISERFRISYWDGAIVAAAQALGAQTLYTEDLNHKQAYGAVTIINPFLNGSPESSFHDNEQTALAKD